MLAAFAGQNWPRPRPNLDDLRDLSVDPLPSVLDTTHLVSQAETEIALAMYKSAFPSRPQPDIQVTASGHHNVSNFSKVRKFLFL